MVFQSFTKYILALGAITSSFALVADATPPAVKDAAVDKDVNVPAKKVPTKEELFSQDYINRLSQTYGHLIQRSLNNPMIKLNPKEVMKGMQDGLDGKTAPLTEKDYEEALTLIQQYSYDDAANKNLAEAEALLKKNATEKGVVSLEEGKIQYQILKEGSGVAETGNLDVVTEETIPTINYDATYSNGQKLGSSEQTGGPIDVKLNETIPGFKKGMLGMKLGEKRRVLIHPDFGFGKTGQLPNGLLVFEIEVTKIAPKPADVEANDDDMDDDDEDEDDDDDLANLLSTDDFMADADEDDGDEEEDEEEFDSDMNFNRASSQDQPVTSKK